MRFLALLLCLLAAASGTKKLDLSQVKMMKSAVAGDQKTITATGEVLLPIADAFNKTLCAGLEIAARDLERVAVQVKGKNAGQGEATREAMLMLAVDLKELKDNVKTNAAAMRLCGEELILHQELGVIRASPRLVKSASSIVVYMKLAKKVDGRLDRLSKMPGFPAELQEFFKNLRDGIEKRLLIGDDLVARTTELLKVLADIEKGVISSMADHQKKQMTVLKQLESLDMSDVPKQWQDTVSGLQEVAKYGEAVVPELEALIDNPAEAHISGELRGEVFVITESTYLVAAAALGIHDTAGAKAGELLQPLESIQATWSLTMDKMLKLASKCHTRDAKLTLRHLVKTGKSSLELLEMIEGVMAKEPGVAEVANKAKELFSRAKERQDVINLIAGLRILGNIHLANKVFHMSSAHSIEPEEVRAVEIAVAKDAAALKQGGPEALARQLLKNPHLHRKYESVAAAAKEAARLKREEAARIARAAHEKLTKERADRHAVYDEFMSPEEKVLMERGDNAVATGGTTEEQKNELLHKYLSSIEQERLKKKEAEAADRNARKARLRERMEMDMVPGQELELPDSVKFRRLANEPLHKQLMLFKKKEETAGDYAKTAAITPDGEKSSEYDPKFVPALKGGTPDLTVLKGAASFLPMEAEQQVPSSTEHKLSPALAKSLGKFQKVDSVLDKSVTSALTRVHEVRDHLESFDPEALAPTQVKERLQQLHGKAVKILDSKGWSGKLDGIASLGKSVGGRAGEAIARGVDTVDQVKSLRESYSKVANSKSVKEGLASARSALDGSKQLMGSLGAQVPIFNKIDQGMDVIEKSGDAIKHVRDIANADDFAGGLTTAGAGLGAVAGAGAALGKLIGGKEGKKVGQVMGKVGLLSRGAKSLVTAGKHVGKMFQQAADLGVAGVTSLVNAGAVIGKVIGGKIGKIISSISTVVTAVMSASPLAIVTGAIEGLKIIGKIIPGKVGQKIGELGSLLGDHLVGYAVKAGIEGWKMLKKGKVVDGLFHMGKHLNPLSWTFSLTKKLGNWIGGDVGRGIAKFAGGLLKATHFAFDVAKKAFKKIIVAPAKKVLKGLESLSNAIFGKEATALIKKAITGVAKSIFKGVKAVGKAVFDGVKGLVKGVGKVFKGVGKGIGKAAKSVGKAVKKIFKGW